MIESKMFFDTNLLVYLYSTDPKALIVERLIQSHFDEICLSTQVLNELYSVLTRKHLKTQEEAQIIITSQFSYWDSLMIAAALEAGCSTLYSEDLQHTHVIEESLTILNPFLMD